MNKVYCAGRFDFDFLNPNYREKAEKDYRSVVLGDVDKLLQKHDYIQLTEHLHYIGPFYFETEGMIDEIIVENEVEMIKKCTHAIFLLDNGLCPGTIAELLLASNLGKKVEIFYVRKNDNEETESKLHSPCWFAMIMSRQINSNTNITACKDYMDAVQKIQQFASSF